MKNKAVSIIGGLIMFIICRYLIETEMDTTKTVKYEEAKLKSGDIICYRWRYVDTGFRFFSRYSHIGLVIKQNNKLYIVETHPKETYWKKDNTIDERKPGVHIYPLRRRLNEYDGKCFYISYLGNKKQSEINREFIKNYKMYKNIPFDESFKFTFLYGYFLKKIGFTRYDKNHLFCSELISKILYDIGVIPDEYMCAEPGTFVGYEVNNKKIYSNQKLLILR